MNRFLSLFVLVSAVIASTAVPVSAGLPDTDIVIIGGEGVVDASVEAALASCTTGTVTRLAGNNRYATAVEVSRSTFTTSDVVYLATGENFPDALAAGPVASASGGAPILLVATDTLPVVTQDEIARLKPSRIVILGGSGAVSTTTEGLIAKAFPAATIERIAGPDRFATAAAISERYFPEGVGVAFIATGTNFPDALAGGVDASVAGGPMLLTSPDVIPPATAAELTRLDPAEIVVLGGPGVIGDTVMTELADFTKGTVRRLAGSDRYATAATIALDAYPGRSNTVYVATALNFPDALAVTPVATDGPLVLVSKSDIPAPSRAVIESLTGVPCESIALVTSPVLAIGDSVMRGVACNPTNPPCYSPSVNLESEIPELTSNAAVSRQFFEAKAIVETEINAGRTPGVLVIHLGTNSPPTSTQIDDLMEAAKTIPRVLIVTVKLDRTWEAQTNAALQDAVSRYPKAELVDWYSLAAANPSWLAADKNAGAHLWTAGARSGYVELIRSAVMDG